MNKSIDRIDLDKPMFSLREVSKVTLLVIIGIIGGVIIIVFSWVN
jgi:hypothetical protein